MAACALGVIAAMEGSGTGLSAQGRGGRDPVNKKMLALYGLKWNPFAPDVPVEALHVTRRIESFCWRVQQLAERLDLDLTVY
jgi:hypothetical protein